ncbi:hypothetical protein, partial [Klebsiella pneumoniae]|uniref:hypothetical protein n=1 Tax=Klebsiella pneumoniae TaxID=573 RepID=UPI002551BAB5
LTYHGGDELAQGWLHSFSGLFLFMVALGGLFVLDTVLGRFSTLNNKAKPVVSTSNSALRWPRMAQGPALALMAATVTGTVMA